MKLQLLASLSLLATAHAWAASQHSVQGILLEVHPGKAKIVVSCEAIPGYMEAMVMPFAVRGPLNAKTLVPGASVRFNMVENGRRDYAEKLEVVPFVNYEAEPTEAGRLQLLQRAIDPAAAARTVSIGNSVPDFTLTDQTRRVTHLSDFKGKVVALTFAYSRCPNPNYCFRLSNNLARLERRFHASAGKDLVLMTIVIDPDHDRGAALERYADTWKANPAAWRFLTGPIADIRGLASSLGMSFWNDEGFLIHTFHTVVIDREGRLAANMEGNQFTAVELGDMVETVLKRPYRHPSLSAAVAPRQ